MPTALITGASSGIGKATALELARRGFAVFGTSRHIETAQALLDEARAASLDVDVLTLDLRESASIDVAVRAVLERAGRIDLLVNNAGVGAHGAVEDFEDDEVISAFDTNVFGLLRMIRAVLPHMRQRGSGTIVNLSSLVGRVAAPMGGVYAATKHAVEAVSDALHYELLPFGVRVVVIEPGRFQSRFHENQLVARRSGDSSPYAEMSRRFAERFVNRDGAGAGPSGDPHDVAAVIADAAMSDNPKRRYLVGNDAEAIVSMHKRLSDEEFEETMRSMLRVPEEPDRSSV